jgi:hypothetical protein
MFGGHNHRVQHAIAGQHEHNAAMHSLARGNVLGYAAHEASALSHNRAAQHRPYYGATAELAGALVGGAAMGAALLASNAPRTYPGQVLAPAPTVVIQQQPLPLAAPVYYAGGGPVYPAAPQPYYVPLPVPPQYAPPPQQALPAPHYAAPPQYLPQQQQQQQQQQQPPRQAPPPPRQAPPPPGPVAQQPYHAAPQAMPPPAFTWRRKAPLEFSLTPAFEGQAPHPTQKAHDGAPLYEMMEYVQTGGKTL